jgi:hypothetical protein
VLKLSTRLVGAARFHQIGDLLKFSIHELAFSKGGNVEFR